MEDMKLLMAQATDNFLEIEHRTVVTQNSYKSYMWYNKCSKYLLLMIILLLELSMLREAQDHGTATVVGKQQQHGGHETAEADITPEVGDNRHDGRGSTTEAAKHSGGRQNGGFGQNRKSWYENPASDQARGRGICACRPRLDLQCSGSHHKWRSAFQSYMWGSQHGIGDCRGGRTPCLHLQSWSKQCIRQAGQDGPGTSNPSLMFV